MEWSDLWAFYNSVSDIIKAQILNQINLQELLGRLSPKHQIIVMDFAPKPIIKDVWPLLEPETKKALGYSDKEIKSNKSKPSEMSSRMKRILTR